MTKVNGLVTKEIGTKSFMVPGIHNQRDYINQSGLSRAAIFNAVEASLKRLDTPYIDVLQIHRLDHSVKAEEIMKALHDLVQSGKVRYIGASSMYAFELQHLNNVAEKNGWTEFVSMQPEYSLLYREEVCSLQLTLDVRLIAVATGTGDDTILQFQRHWGDPILPSCLWGSSSTLGCRHSSFEHDEGYALRAETRRP